jgi:hypothetical protein
MHSLEVQPGSYIMMCIEAGDGSLCVCSFFRRRFYIVIAKQIGKKMRANLIYSSIYVENTGSPITANGFVNKKLLGEAFHLNCCSSKPNFSVLKDRS